MKLSWPDIGGSVKGMWSSDKWLRTQALGVFDGNLDLDFMISKIETEYVLNIIYRNFLTQLIESSD
jgi:hypothetical protein